MIVTLAFTRAHESEPFETHTLRLSRESWLLLAAQAVDTGTLRAMASADTTFKRPRPNDITEIEVVGNAGVTLWKRE